MGATVLSAALLWIIASAALRTHSANNVKVEVSWWALPVVFARLYWMGASFVNPLPNVLIACKAIISIAVGCAKDAHKCKAAWFAETSNPVVYALQAILLQVDYARHATLRWMAALLALPIVLVLLA